jgi:hypothetical protein
MVAIRSEILRGLRQIFERPIRVDPNEQHWSGQQKTFFRNLPDDMEIRDDEGDIANPAKMKPGDTGIISIKKPPLTS